MPMSFDDAVKIVLMRRKLYDLRAKAPPGQLQPIDDQLARLDPYQQEADDVVMDKSDGDFAQAAKALTKQLKPINGAIADIKQISAALTKAAQIITTIIKVVGELPKVP
jgi:hypothetical protein